MGHVLSTNMRGRSALNPTRHAQRLSSMFWQKKKKLATRQFVFAARFQFFDRVITPAALLGGAAHNMFRRFDNIKNVFGKLLTLGHKILLIGPPYSMKPYILECEKEQNHNIMD